MLPPNGAAYTGAVTSWNMQSSDEPRDESPSDGLERSRAVFEETIRESYAQGATISALAEASGLTEDEVRSILDAT